MNIHLSITATKLDAGVCSGATFVVVVVVVFCIIPSGGGEIVLKELIS